MSYEALEAQCRQAFADGTDPSTLVVEFAAFDREQRIAAWSWLTRNGIQDVDFIKFVHRNFSRLVIEVFGPPVGLHDAGVVTEVPEAFRAKKVS